MNADDMGRLLYDLSGRLRAVEATVQAGQFERQEIKSSVKADIADLRAEVAKLETALSEIKIALVDVVARRAWIERVAYLLVGAVITIGVGALINVNAAKGWWAG